MKITKLLLYCTKAKPYLLHMPKDNEEFKKGIEFSLTLGKNFAEAGLDINDYNLNGKILAECDFEVEEIACSKIDYALSYSIDGNGQTFYENSKEYEPFYLGLHISNIELLKRSHLTNKEMYNYLKGENGYAIHIKNLHIFDNPRFLEGFDDNKGHTLRKAPQNMCKILRVNVGEYDYKDLNSDAYEPCILISIKPEDLCKILNGEKTIIIKKRILKEIK